MQFNTASDSHTQPANVLMQQSAARQPIVNSTVPAAGILGTVEDAASHVTAPDSCRGLQSQKWGGCVADSDAAIPPAAADLVQGSQIAAAAKASPVVVSHDAAAAEAGLALGSSEAAAAESDLAHDNQEAAAGEADAATMAAWLIQKPSLLQGVLGHLESLAANTFLKSSASTPYLDPPAGLLASSSTGNKLSAVSACDTRASATTWGCCHHLEQLKSGVELHVAASAGWRRWDQGWHSFHFAGSFC